MNVLGYPMSYLEFAGTLLNLLSVYLVTRNSIWTWPVGNVAVFLFALLFYQIRLYVDVAEQVYFSLQAFTDGGLGHFIVTTPKNAKQH